MRAFDGLFVAQCKRSLPNERTILFFFVFCSDGQDRLRIRPRKIVAEYDLIFFKHSRQKLPRLFLVGGSG